MSRLSLIAVALIAPFAAPAQRVLDFTGNPAAAIAEPFTQIVGVRELQGNRVVVTDQIEHALYIADFAANAVKPLGRQGEGPAEYRFPMRPLAGRANGTWVVDATLRRTLNISPAGTIVGTTPTPSGGLAAGVVSARGSDAAGRLYMEGNSFDAERGRFSDSVAIVRWNPVDGATAIVTRVWSGGRVMVKTPQGDMSMARNITPFPSLDAWVVRPNGDVVVVHHEPFRIDVVDSAGRVNTGAPIAFQPMPVTEADRAAFRKAMSFVRTGAALKNGGTGAARSGRSVSDEEFPAAMPAFVAASVIASPDGAVWIGRSHAAGDATRRYDVYDAKGTLSFVAKLRANATIVGFGTGVVYIARTDPADDLVYLERFAR